MRTFLFALSLGSFVWIPPRKHRRGLRDRSGALAAIDALLFLVWPTSRSANAMRSYVFAEARGAAGATIGLRSAW